MTTAARVCPSCSTPLPDEAQFCMHCGRATPTEPGVPQRTMPTGEVEVATVTRVLADRYRIERVIGEGGMATVYLAEDLKHRRKVAVKVMRPELAATLGADRFLREVEIAAQLNHPHILPMYDSGSAGGVLYYVMPYVEGESLAARIAREGELPVAVALRLGREVAEALAYAHKRGIVHRDIKPANILISEGHALVADFGIARAVGAEGEAITRTGLAIGTPQYMSPEQASGDKEVDGRTDIYALGAVLYEMLTGEPPFTGRSAQAVISRSMTERPRPLGASRAGLPPALEPVVMRALARSAADRHPTGEELATALERVADAPSSGGAAAAVGSGGPATRRPWLIAGVLALVALGAVAFMAGRWGLPRWVLGAAVLLLALGAVMLAFTAREERRRSSGLGSDGLGRMLTWRNAGLGGLGAVLTWALLAAGASASRAGSAAPAVGGTHVAVLPFQNQGDSADNYIVDGISDEIRGKLARIDGLAVIASNSSSQYRNSSMPPVEIASELGARFLLQGRVRWAGAGDARRVQVVAELVDGTTGGTEWQQTFEAPLTDVFEVQSQIAARVAGAMGTRIGAQEERTLERRPTVNPAAWDAYLRGKAITAVDPVSMRRAAGFFEQAVALDADFADAWASLSMATTRVYGNGARELQMARRSRESFERAIATDSGSALGYAAAAMYYTGVRPDARAADEALATALRLSPNDPEVLAAAARADINRGGVETGVARLERARELDPRSIAILTDLQRANVSAGRYPEAIEVGDAAIALAPDDPAVYEYLAMARVAEGDLEAARAGSRQAVTNGISAPTLAAYFAGYFEMGWALDSAIQEIIPRLTVGAFDGDRAWWGQSLATHHWTSGRPDLAKVYADSALGPSLVQVQQAPEDPSPLILYAVMLAYAGHRDSALATIARVTAMREGDMPASFNFGYDLYQFARIYLALGEPERAMDVIEQVLRNPGQYSRGWVRLDPLFTSLRGNARFERLVRSEK